MSIHNSQSWKYRDTFLFIALDCQIFFLPGNFNKPEKCATAVFSAKSSFWCTLGHFKKNYFIHLSNPLFIINH